MAGIGELTELSHHPSDMIHCQRVPSISTPRAKLTADDVRAIRIQSKEGAARNALALLYDVSVQTIKAVRSGRHYGDIA